MHVDLAGLVIRDLNTGAAVQCPSGEKDPGSGRPKTIDLTAAWAVIDALMYEPERQPLSGVEKLRRYELAAKIKAAGSAGVDLTLDELNTALKAVEAKQPAAIYGPIAVYCHRFKAPPADASSSRPTS